MAFLYYLLLYNIIFVLSIIVLIAVVRAEAKMEMVEALVSLLQVHDVEVQQASSLALSNLALKGPGEWGRSGPNLVRWTVL